MPERERLPDMVGQMLCAKGYTISCAESCTGGLLTSMLTDVPGSSAHGAVSPETARAMAEGVRDLMQTDVGVGITGIAGPGGGSPEKPVGLVYIAVSAPGKTSVEKNVFSGVRAEIKRAAVNKALAMVQEMIREMDE